MRLVIDADLSMEISAESWNSAASAAHRLSIKIRTSGGLIEIVIFNNNPVGSAALAQAINQVSAEHFKVSS